MAFTAAELGFVADGDGWRAMLRGVSVRFRQLTTVPDFLPVEELQQLTWGFTDRQVVPAHELMVAADTGGAVIGAWREGDDELAGFVLGWGGYRQGQPRLNSDMLAVRPAVRNLGLGFALKTLQAALALEQGFPEMVWTVDPLRAPNARLNIAKLGGYSHEYQENLYGNQLGTTLAGDLPTDVIVLTWPIASERVRARLLHGQQGPDWSTVSALPTLDEQPSLLGHAPRLLVELPAEIDRLLDSDPVAARQWRLTVRQQLQRTFAAGYAITEFVTAPQARAFFILEHGWQPH